MLQITNLQARVEDKDILKGINLTVEPAKCTRSWGRTAPARARSRTCSPAGPATRSPAAASTFDGKDLLDLDPEERAREGVFLAFQYPVEIPGVSNSYFLKAALNAMRKHRGESDLDAIEFMKLVKAKMKLLKMDQAFLSRSVNEGFSGGEKKRNEIFQMAVLEPRLALLDETDSGLDIDALKIVAEGVNALRSPERVDDRRDALSAAAELHRPRLRARALRRPHRQVRRQGARARARGEGLRLARTGGGGPGMSITATQTTSNDAREAYYGRVDAARGRAAEPAWLTSRRAAAARQLLAEGFPTTRDEELRFTNVAPVTAKAYPAADVPPARASLDALLEEASVPGLDAHESCSSTAASRRSCRRSTASRPACGSRASPPRSAPTRRSSSRCGTARSSSRCRASPR